ncbi:MAG: DUF969 domain-containing protein [Pseudomonadota bacterium]
MSLWPLLGLAVVVLGFALRANPLLVVAVSSVVTGLAAKLPILKLLAMLGEAFLKNRILLLFVLTLPVIGLLERHGLREHATRWIASMRAVTASRLLTLYLTLRQLTATVGLTSLAGHAQTVRPLLAPMTEAAAEKVHGPLPEASRLRLRALCAATDNVGLFFGEDLFLAFGAVLLIQAFFQNNGIQLQPLQIAVWGIPTAVCAFLIHAGRLWQLEARLRREASLASAKPTVLPRVSTDSGSGPRDQ